MSEIREDKIEAQKRMKKYSKEEIAQSFYEAMVLGTHFNIQAKRRGDAEFEDDMYRIAEGAYNIRGTKLGKRSVDNREAIMNRYRNGRYVNEYNSYRKRLTGTVTREDILWVLKKYPQGIPDDRRWLNKKFPNGVPGDVPDYKPFEEILWERQMEGQINEPYEEPYKNPYKEPSNFRINVKKKVPKKFRIPSGILIKAVGAVVAVIVLFVLVRAGVRDISFKKYTHAAFEYGDAIYLGNLKRGKPRGLCTSIPLHSDGKFYALGEFDGDTINGYGIVCTSNIALQSGQSNRAEVSTYDEAKLQIKMGEMEGNVLSGYGVMWMSSEEIILGNFKDEKLKNYGCRVLFDENGSIASVDILKKDKVKKRIKKGTYKGITFKPENNSITIGGVTYTISGHEVTLKAKGVVLTVNGRNWEMNLFNEKSEEGVYMKYALGEIATCEVRKIKGSRLNTYSYEWPIVYCIYCGKQLPGTSFCLKCGKQEFVN